jgi:hypothetical protein
MLGVVVGQHMSVAGIRDGHVPPADHGQVLEQVPVKRQHDLHGCYASGDFHKGKPANAYTEAAGKTG